MRLAFIVTVVLLLMGTHLLARRIEVGKSGHATIRNAIASAMPGDTVLIPAGTYKEGNIVIEKPMVILGKDRPVLDGENKFEILTIHADHVTIIGLHLINTGVASIVDIAAVKVLDSKYVTIVDNELENTFFGIFLANCSHSIIGRNRIVSTEADESRKANGIHLWKCNHITIDGNTIHAHRDGIYFEFVTESLIANNVSAGNLRYGLHFMFSHNDDYRNNKFINNGSGVAVMYSKEVSMADNSFSHNWGSAAYGLLLKDIRDSKVIRNSFSENSVGIFMEGSSRMHFRDNEFIKNGYAIRLQASCDGNTFERNNFKGNTFDLVTNGSLMLNNINGNYWDKYEGYDLDGDMIGDIPFRPISLYGTIIEKTPTAVLLWRSFLVYLIDRAERAIPVITPENLFDGSPLMTPRDILR